MTWLASVRSPMMPFTHVLVGQLTKEVDRSASCGGVCVHTRSDVIVSTMQLSVRANDLFGRIASRTSVTH